MGWGSGHCMGFDILNASKVRFGVCFVVVVGRWHNSHCKRWGETSDHCMGLLFGMGWD